MPVKEDPLWDMTSEAAKFGFCDYKPEGSLASCVPLNAKAGNVTKENMD